jgi:hypothetical protein
MAVLTGNAPGHYIPPMQHVTLANILHNRGNTFNVWANFHPKLGVRPRADSARDRLISGETVIVWNRPRFQIKPGATVYTIGSCFARNVERALRQVGCVVPTADFAVPAHLYSHPTPFPNTVLNKYTPPAIAAEIYLGLGEERNAAPVEVQPNKWLDPLAPVLKLLDLENVRGLREKFRAVAASVATADAVFMTLGLTECWYDIATSGVYNGFSTESVRGHADGIGFFNATVEQSVSALSEAITRLKERNPATKIVLTVSPVPLGLTFTDMDVISANTYSKATLRASCEVLRQRFDFVDYFPSYEMVVNSPRASTWLDDQIHVRQEVVDTVISTFAERYISSGRVS